MPVLQRGRVEFGSVTADPVPGARDSLGLRHWQDRATVHGDRISFEHLPPSLPRPLLGVRPHASLAWPKGCPEAATPEPQAATTRAIGLPDTHPRPTRGGGCPSHGNWPVCRRCVLRSSTFRLPAAHHRGSNRRDTGHRGSPRYARLAPGLRHHPGAGCRPEKPRAPSRIRTDTLQILSLLPLPIGL